MLRGFRGTGMNAGLEATTVRSLGTERRRTARVKKGRRATDDEKGGAAGKADSTRTKAANLVGRLGAFLLLRCRVHNLLAALSSESTTKNVLERAVFCRAEARQTMRGCQEMGSHPLRYRPKPRFPGRLDR
ncbi:hypothetical protein MRX96_024049 [Rhipicephalus microplus]